MDQSPSQQEIANALAALMSKITEFNAAMSAAGQPEITFTPFPDLVEDPSPVCLLNWAVVYTLLIGDYIDCIENHSGDQPAMQACCDAAYAFRVGQLQSGCTVQA